jgi:hypothetical protein
MIMASNKAHKKTTVRRVESSAHVDEKGKYLLNPRFTELDRKAQAFLKKHPIPEKFLK